MADIAAPADPQRPTASPAHELAHPRTGVTIIGDDALDEGEVLPVLPSQHVGAVAVLDVGGVNIDAWRLALCVDEDATLVVETLSVPAAS